MFEPFIQTIASIHCSFCSVEYYRAYELDEDVLKELGWQVRGQYCYCPRCAKERLHANASRRK